MRFVLEPLDQRPVVTRRREFVECKGIGHPDTLCDALVEAISSDLARMYLDRLGFIAHYNIDKALLAAGQCEKTFLRGRVTQPMRLILGDRATFAGETGPLPVEETVANAVDAWLQQHLPKIRVHQELVLEPVLAPGSTPLRGIYQRPEEIVANDTSGAVGFAPFTPTERLTRKAADFLTSTGFKQRFPDTGRDVKVFAVRTDERVEITVAMPFDCEHIDCESTYFRRKEEVLHALHEELSQNDLEVAVRLNTLDRHGCGADGLYLTLTGTSAEDADSGQVGRGNRVCGFISFARPVGGEAAPGKNPVAHVGKLYSVASQRLAERIHAAHPELTEVYVSLATRIGEPIVTPWASVQVLLSPKQSLGDIEPSIREIVARELEQLPAYWQGLLRGEFRLY